MKKDFVLKEYSFTTARWFIVFFMGMRLLSNASVQPIKLTCEYLENPLGIDSKNPRLGWNMVSNQRNQSQSAYEILVADNLKDIQKQIGNIWSTGKITSTQSQQIEFAGVPLKSFTRYYWTVKIYDKDNFPSAYSTLSNFETAMLNKTDWIASWIGDDRKQFTRDEDFYQVDPMPIFRKKINITKDVSSARLYISGLGYYEAKMNNTKIGNNVLDPGFTAYKKQILYTTYDVNPLLKKGINTLGVMLGNGWYNPLPLRLFSRFNLRNFQETGRPCLKAQVLIQYTDGTKETIFSDESWQTTKGPVIKNNVYLGEQYDARLEKNFDEDQNWQNASLVTAPSGEMILQMQPPIRTTKILKSKTIKEVGKDTFIVDFGQNFAGVAKIKVAGIAGTSIRIRYGEDTFSTGRLNYLTTVAGHIKEMWNLKGGPGSPKTAWQQDEYILKGNGVETWSPRFTFHGFRYAEITGWPGKPSLNDIEGLRMNTDLMKTGDFSCSNESFNKLHEVIQWTFMSNIFSVQSDCPGREKMGYGGDMVATADAFSYNYDMSHFYSKTVRDFANDQQPDGGITEIAPYTGIADRGYGGESGPLGWQLAYPFIQKKLYEFYGNKRIIEEQYPNVLKQIDFLQAKAINGLFHWDISDHEALDPKPEAFTAACFYYHHLLLAIEFSDILEKKEDKKRFEDLAKKVKTNIIRKYQIPNTGRFDLATQSAQVFALYYHLNEDSDQAKQVLMNEFERHQWHISTGIFATKMMFDVLRSADENEVAYRLTNQKDYPGWLYMLDHDATTLWESWKKPDQASLNHPMFGSVDEWFYRSILGINAADPGFKKIMIKPQVAGDLTWAKGSYQSIYGLISMDWKKSNGSSSYKISIPANTIAEIWLPSNENSTVIEDQDPNLTKIKYEKGYSVYNVGSGSYNFRVTP
ncbi:MAG: family 78 glycoside hydrolase catalytic domain [Saprospiraceae bacterium]